MPMKIKLSRFFACCFIALSTHLSFSVAAQDKAPVQYKVGQATVYVLEDIARAQSASIFSGASAEEIKKLTPSGEVSSSISAFLIKMDDRLILVDAGMGQSSAPKSLLLDKLRQNDVMVEQITHVLLTHLHGDHVGGLVWEGKATFPNAQVFVGGVERDYWLNSETLEKNPDRKGNIELIQRAFMLYGDRVKTIAFNQEVLPGITALAAVGHTPGHTVFMLESQGKKMLFWGDLVHGAALQFRNPEICAHFDMSVSQSVAARRKFMEIATESGIPVAGAHLPSGNVIKVGKEEKGGFTYVRY